MDIVARDEIETHDLYDVMHHVDWTFSSLYEGGSGVGDIGKVIPFDDAAALADSLLARNAYYSYREYLEQASVVTYTDLYAMDRESIVAWQRSLPTSTIEEIFRRAQMAEAAFQVTSRTFVAAIKDRSLEIKFDHGDGLSPANLAGSWHAICAEYSSLRNLKSDLRDAAWLEHKNQWQDIEQEVVEAILAMRECFDWDQLTSRRSAGQALIWWPLEATAQEQLAEANTHLSRAKSMWDFHRAELFRQVDEHFEFYSIGSEEPGDRTVDSYSKEVSRLPRLSADPN